MTKPETVQLLTDEEINFAWNAANRDMSPRFVHDIFARAIEQRVLAKLAEKAEPPGCDHCLGGKVDAGGTAHDCDYPNCINFTNIPTDTALVHAAEKLMKRLDPYDFPAEQAELFSAIKAHKGEA